MQVVAENGNRYITKERRQHPDGQWVTVHIGRERNSPVEELLNNEEQHRVWLGIAVS